MRKERKALIGKKCTCGKIILEEDTFDILYQDTITAQKLHHIGYECYGEGRCNQTYYDEY